MTLTQNNAFLKKIPQWLTALLVILLGITLAKLLWIFLTPEDKGITKIASSQQQSLAQPKRQPNYGRIIEQQHLFGEVKKVVVAAPVRAPVKVAPPKPPKKVIPKLKIHLAGIMSYSSKKSGYALLSYNRKPQGVYEVGEALDEEKKVRIHSISAEKVVISNHGRLEDFSLPKRTPYKKGTPAISMNTAINTPPRSASTAIRSRTRARTPNDFMLGGASTPPSISPQPTKSTATRKSDAFSIKNISEFREKVMSDPSKLMEIATAQPYSRNGEMLGFRVRPGKNRRAFRQLGLRNGDVIKEVNGITLDSNEKGFMLMGELSGASELSVTVLRGKREVQLPTLHF